MAAVYLDDLLFDDALLRTRAPMCPGVAQHARSVSALPARARLKINHEADESCARAELGDEENSKRSASDTEPVNRDTALSRERLLVHDDDAVVLDQRTHGRADGASGRRLI